MNTIYENEIIENKMTELLNTRLDARALMTVDTSLSENAGLRKVINRYTYNGSVENLAKGEKNTVKGTVSFVPEYYDVKRYQQTFEYNDMDAMADPYIVDVAMQGAVTEITNEINEEYFNEILKVGTKFAYENDGACYADFVDALSLIDCEIDSGLFIIMGSEARKQIRKDPDFISAKQGEIVYSGQFGTICGVPVLFSKLMPSDRIVITNKNAVRFFVKKSASVEQARDIETKDNTVVYERHGLIALVDDTSSVILGKAPVMLNWNFIENVDGQGMTQIDPVDTPRADRDYYYLVSAPAIFENEAVDLEGWSKIEKSGFSFQGAERGKTVTVVEVDENCIAKRIAKHTYKAE